MLMNFNFLKKITNKLQIIKEQHSVVLKRFQIIKQFNFISDSQNLFLLDNSINNLK